MQSIKNYIYEQVAANKLPVNDAAKMLREFHESLNNIEDDIAIIGMSGKFPMARNLDEYWENLENGVDCVSKFPDNRREYMDFHLPQVLKPGDNPYKVQGFLDDIDKFDASFFNMTPAEANLVEPSQRLLLQTIWEAIEDAGLGGDKLYGHKAGVYVGRATLGESTYMEFLNDFDMVAFTGSVNAITASRISYFLNLKGMSLVVDTACSSGLVALHLASQSLKNKECEVAIVGGVSLNLFPLKEHSLDLLESSDSTLRPFDGKANGTVWGEGICAVIIKPLGKAILDGDNIHAIIKGSACNNDGASNGITAPNPIAQEELLVKLWDKTKVNPQTISYIETHSTGTPIGDPVEVRALTNAFRKFTDKKQFCGIGTVKANTGHLIASSGLAALIKVVLSFKHKKIPKTINFEQINPYINLQESPLYVVDKLNKWEKEGQPRRAGVSSFGLSGTNCHVILEEAPELDNTAEPCGGVMYIMTISAKNEQVLKDLLNSYREFGEKDESSRLEDICYTANTGRGHYSYRIALIVKNKEDLFEKIKSILERELSDINDKFVYYSHARIAASAEPIAQNWNITESKNKELTKKATEMVNEFIATSMNNAEIAQEICMLYVKGSSIEWNSLYKERKVRRISLPVYPFQKNKCWIPDVRKKMPASVKEKERKALHPLIDMCLAESLEQDIYLTLFKPEKHWVMEEHRIMDLPVIPGTAYIEMAFWIGEIYYPGKTLELKDVSFILPAVYREPEALEVQTIVKKCKDFLEFIITSKKSNEDEGSKSRWDEHVRGRIQPVKSEKPSTINIEEIIKGCGRKETGIDLNKITNGMIKFGPKWDNCQRLHIGNNIAIAEMILNEANREDAHEYLLHPSLMDVAVNVACFYTLNDKYLPMSYGSMKIYSTIPARFYSLITRKDNTGSNTEIVTYDIVLVDQMGEILVEIFDYSLKKINGLEKFLVKDNLFSVLKWIPLDIERETQVKKKNGTILILNDQNGMSKKLAENFEYSGNKVIQVGLGRRFERLGDNSYIIRGTESDYDKLFEEISSENVSQILHMFSITGRNDNETVEELEDEIKIGAYSLFYLTRSMLKKGNIDTMDIVLVTENTYEVTGVEKNLKPANAALIGLGKTVSNEYVNLRCRSVDIDSNTETKTLVAEFELSESCYMTAYRDGRRYVEEVDGLNIEKVEKHRLEVRDTGVYIITGGTGAIGLEASRYLASKNRVNLALVNRSKMVEREEWDGILERGENVKLCNILKVIRDIEAEGSVVSCYSADVSKLDEMKALIEGLRAKYGRINGIIHSAGIAGDGFIIQKDEEVFNTVIRPKIYGTWIMDRLTREDKLDFYVMFSSVASLIGVPGQGDYTAANSYMDAFEAYRNSLGLQTMTINWPAWKEVGMAVDYRANTDTVFKAISTKLAMELFDNVMNMKIKRVVIGEWNYGSEIIDYLPLRFSSRLKAHMVKMTNKLELSAVEVKNVTDMCLKGRKDDKYTDTEIKIGQIWSEVLGYNEINIYDNLFALGGNSIIAMKLLNSINESMEITISVSEIFNYMNIAELAKFIDQKTSKDTAPGAEHVTIIPAVSAGYYPVSSEQKRLYVLHCLAPDSVNYNVSMVMVIEGKIELSYIEEVFEKLIQRHDALRTYFQLVDGNVVQRVLDNISLKIEYQEDDEGKIDDIIRGFIRPFDLGEAPLYRAKLVRAADEKYYLILDSHHIVTDGSSAGILISELFTLVSRKSLPELRLQYKDYAVWQNSVSGLNAIKSHEEFWLNELSGDIPVLNIPLDCPRPAVRNFEGKVLEFVLDKDLTLKLKKISSDSNTTLFVTLLAAYNVLLWKYTGQEDIIVGSPVRGRVHADLENVIGMFVNTLPIRSYPVGDKSFEVFLKEVKERVLKMLENQIYRFEELVEKLELTRDTSRDPLFDTMFVFQNIGKGIEITDAGMQLIEKELDDLKFYTYKFDRKTSKYDITLEIIERNEQLVCYIEYCTKLFKEETIQRMIGHFKNVVIEISDNPSVILSDIEMLSASEKEKLFGFNNTLPGNSEYQSICEIFEEQVKKRPDNIAVVFQYKHLTYMDLDERVNQLANYLIEVHKIENGTLVGILMERSELVIISILGILKAGGAYVPIDTGYPEERMKLIIDDADIGIVISTHEHISVLDRLQIQCKSFHTYLCMDTGNIDLIEKDEQRKEKSTINEKSKYQHGNKALEKQPKELLRTPLKPLDTAYVIYTSGSTGKPKGVMVGHGSVINILMALQEEYPLIETDSFLFKTTYTFDVSVAELFGCFLGGGKLVVLPRGEEKEPEGILKAVEEYDITHINFVPSMLSVFINYLSQKDACIVQKLKYIFAAGEALSAEIANRFYNLVKDVRLVNLYGPTESTVYATRYSLEYSTQYMNVSIGKAFKNIQAFVLDKHNKMQPVGVPGELYLGGRGVAIGYVNNIKLTNEKFIPNPFVPGERIYKTGDLVRWLEDGNLEFLGRIDNQVKIRGYRIEPEEIEAQLLKYMTVRDATVVAYTDENGDKYLCAYIVCDSEQKEENIRSFLVSRLPNYMIPKYIILMERLPLSVNGKVDRKSLPRPQNSIIDRLVDYVSPRDEVEEIIAGVWGEVLGLKQVGINYDFFEIGGDSIKAIQISAKLRKYGLKLDIKDLFRYHRISELRSYIVSDVEYLHERGEYLTDSKVVEHIKEQLNIPNIDIKAVYDLTPMQEGMLFHSLMTRDEWAYYDQYEIRINGNIDMSIFKESWNTVVSRHDILRTVFWCKNTDKPKQVVLKEVGEKFYFEDISNLDKSEIESYICDFKNSDIKNKFDLFREPAMRISMLKVGEQSYVVLWYFHHIVLDGWSQGVLIDELLQVYSCKLKGTPLYMGNPYPFANYIDWVNQKNQDEAREYWNRYLEEYQSLASIPKVSIEQENSNYEFKKFNFYIDKEYTLLLEDIAEKNCVTLNIVFQTMWGILLQKYNNTDDVVFGAVVSGRSPEIEGIESIVGLLINTIPVRIKCKDTQTLSEVLRQIQEDSLKSKDHEYFPLYEIQNDHTLKGDLLDHIIVFQNFPMNNSRRGKVFEDFFVTDINTVDQTSFDLNIMVIPEEGLNVIFKYNAYVYDMDFLEDVACNFRQIIKLISRKSDITLKELKALINHDASRILMDFNEDLNDLRSLYYKSRIVIESTIQDQLRTSFQKYSDKIAIEYGDKVLTYYELDSKSSIIAGWIIKENLAKGTHIGILLDSKIELIFTIIGILKAGCVFVPLDSNYPDHRLRAMASTSELKIILTDIRNLDRIEDILIDCSEVVGGKLICDIVEASSQKSDVILPENLYTADDKIYIYFTSGTTGVPKAIIGRNRGLLHFVCWETNTIGIDESFRVSQLTSPGFNAYLRDVFVPLCSGGTICIPESREIILESDSLVNWVEKSGVRLVHCTPSLFRLINSVSLTPNSLKNVEYVLMAGERIIPKELEHWYAVFGDRIQLVNLYGSTETTMVKLFYFIDETDAKRRIIPAGKPMKGAKVIVVDDNFNVCPVGGIGEILIRTPYRTFGYYKSQEMNKDKFIPNPFCNNPEDILYRTGDLGRILPDGELECICRMDRQVKIRGARVEISDIENTLMSFGGVKACAVAANEDKKGIKYLCAYILLENTDEKPLLTDVRNFMAKNLPDYMIPQFFRIVDKIPFTQNGKVDYDALPKPEDIITEELLVPRDEIEEEMASIWCEILEVESIGINQNFLQVGGHSLNMMTLISKINQKFGVKISLEQLFTNPTIEAISDYIRSSKRDAFKSIQPVEKRVYYPLSFAQKRMFILSQFEGQSTNYNISEAFIINGKFDFMECKEAFRSLINRHESLRTSFDMIDGEPVQYVHDEVDFDIEYEEIDGQDLNTSITAFIRPFVLKNVPLIRIGVYKITDTKNVLVLDAHHIIFDGLSFNVAIKDFVSLYKSHALPLLKIHYKDFSVWQNDLLLKGIIKKQEEYWLNKLGGDIPVLNMSTDYPRPAIQSFNGDKFEMDISKELTGRLKSLALNEGVTLHMLLLAGYNILISKYTMQDDIIVGIPVGGRNHNELSNIIGMFVNTLAIRNHPTADNTFRQFLSQVKNSTLEAYQNQDYPFEELVSKLNIVSGMDRNPVFDTMFTFWNTGVKNLDIDSLSISPYVIDKKQSKFDFCFNAIDIDDSVKLVVEYCTDLYKKETMERMGIHFQNILKCLVNDPNLQICNIRILTDSENVKLLEEFNSTDYEYPYEITAQELFEEQVRKNLDKIAVVFKEQALTYGELNKKINKLAAKLRREGVKQNTIVGMVFDRSIEMVIALMSVIKSGGAFLPIDSSYPEERISYMLQDSNANVIITQKRLKRLVPDNKKIIFIEDENNSLEDENNIDNISKPENLLYIIYTSGTTGKPKGVMVEHRSFINLTYALRKVYDLDNLDTSVLQMASFSFDVFISNISRSLLIGGKLVICPDEVKIDLNALYLLVEEHQINIFESSPALVVPFMDYIYENKLNISSMKLLIVGSDTVSGNDFERLNENFGSGFRIINSYGVTEATIDSSCFELSTGRITPSGNVPIGKPLPNTKFYILDPQQNIQPVGVIGELYIGGIGVARGYLNNNELTEKKFICNPFKPGERLYRTGDLARWLSDGNIEFIGRCDSQVKISGYRVELGEIENKLIEYEMIKNAAVIVKLDYKGIKQICAFYVSDNVIEEAILREYLSSELPYYMVPSLFVLLKKIPLTPNGKIDYRELDKVDIDLESKLKYEKPSNEIERKLVEIMQEVLEIYDIGISDDFFLLGGQSISAMRFISKASASGLCISIQDLYKHRTIKGISLNMCINNSCRNLLNPEINKIIKKEKSGVFIENTIISERSEIDRDLYYNNKILSHPYLCTESRPLINMIATGKLPKVDSAALGYLDDEYIDISSSEHDKIIDYFFGGTPIVSEIRDTGMGRIASILLPIFRSELYSNQVKLVSLATEGIKLANLLGARTISLTGLIPSATDYGIAIKQFINDGQIDITTGHSTTTAAVVLSLKRLLAESRRELADEQVCILGLGSIGTAVLKLMLKVLSHPQNLILCDVYEKRNELHELCRSLQNEYGFNLNIEVVCVNDGVEIPEKIYQSSLIVGATNVPEILDIDKIRPGTMIIDDSAPHCFSIEKALQRLKEYKDILFTEGGIIETPDAIHKTVYWPKGLDSIMPLRYKDYLANYREREITGCILSSILTEHNKLITPSVGSVNANDCIECYRYLTEMGYCGARLHCENIIIENELIEYFSSNFGKK